MIKGDDRTHSRAYDPHTKAHGQLLPLQVSGRQLRLPFYLVEATGRRVILVNPIDRIYGINSSNRYKDTFVLSNNSSSMSDRVGSMFGTLS
jgi:hypothetical protein